MKSYDMRKPGEAFAAAMAEETGVVMIHIDISKSGEKIRLSFGGQAAVLTMAELNGLLKALRGAKVIMAELKRQGDK